MRSVVRGAVAPVVVAVFAFVCGCGSSTNKNAAQPRRAQNPAAALPAEVANIPMYDARSVAKPIEPLARISAAGDKGRPEAMAQLRRKAAALHADAIVDLQQQDDKGKTSFSATAVRYRAKP